MTSPGRPACLAPFTSLHLDPLGTARACCQNSWYRLGQYPDQSLEDIWRGERIAELRDRLAAGDLSAGCHACDVGALDQLRDQVYARRFDHLADGRTSAAPAWPVQLELQLSNRCNLQCAMCTGQSSSAIRAQREHLPPLPTPYDDAFFDQLAAFLPHVQRIELLGGEPFLASETRALVELVERLGADPLFHVTTNGTVLGPWVTAFLADHRVDVTVSIDAATPEVFERIRVGARFADVIANLDALAAIAVERETSLSIATCLMVETAADFHGVLELADQRDLDVYVNTVTDPPSSSLAFAPSDDLRSLLDVMAAQDAARPLGRNAPVWRAELARLEQLADRAGSGPGGRAIASDPERRSAWASGEPVHTFLADAHQLLIGVEPDASSVFGLDLRPVRGQPLATWMEPLRARYGSLVRSDVVRHDDGTSEWTMTLDGDRGRHIVKALCLPEADGARWLVHLRPDAPSASIGPTPVAPPRRRRAPT